MLAQPFCPFLTQCTISFCSYRFAAGMKVTEKEVVYVADLANLELTEAERTAMVRDLNSILGHIEMLNELDTSSVAPMAQVMAPVTEGKEGSERFAYAMREDVLRPSLD